MHQADHVLLGLDAARLVCELLGRDGRADLRWVVRDPQGPAQLEDEDGGVHGYASLDVVRALPAHQRALDAMRDVKIIEGLLEALAADRCYIGMPPVFYPPGHKPKKLRTSRPKAKIKKAKKLGRRDHRRQR